MGRTLSRASLPRDAAGRVDLAAVERALADLADKTPPSRTERVAAAVLLERFSALTGSSPPVASARRNGHPLTAPTFLASPAPVRRPTQGPPSADEATAAPASSPTDVRGIGRVAPAPVTLEDLLGGPSSFAPPIAPPSDRPALALADDAPAAVAPEVELGSLPPLEAGSNPPPAEPPLAAEPAPMPAPSVAPPPLPPSPAVLPAAVAPASLAPPPAAPSRPLFHPFGSGSSSRSSWASIPSVGSVRPPQPVAAEEVAAVGAVFDEFLGSAPVEPSPRPPAMSVPRAAPSPPPGPRRPPSMQVPVFRSPTALAPSAFRATLAPKPEVPDESIEPVEMEDVEVEEIVAAPPSRTPPPLMSRPPALPPLPPKKR